MYDPHFFWSKNCLGLVKDELLHISFFVWMDGFLSRKTCFFCVDFVGKFDSLKEV